jgi:hypothetical protein
VVFVQYAPAAKGKASQSCLPWLFPPANVTTPSHQPKTGRERPAQNDEGRGSMRPMPLVEGTMNNKIPNPPGLTRRLALERNPSSQSTTVMVRQCQTQQADPAKVTHTGFQWLQRGHLSTWFLTWPDGGTRSRLLRRWFQPLDLRNGPQAGARGQTHPVLGTYQAASMVRVTRGTKAGAAQVRLQAAPSTGFCYPMSKMLHHRHRPICP